METEGRVMDVSIVAKFNASVGSHSQGIISKALHGSSDWVNHAFLILRCYGVRFRDIDHRSRLVVNSSSPNVQGFSPTMARPACRTRKLSNPD